MVAPARTITPRWSDYDKAELALHVWVDPDRMGGEPCFQGTRVPVRTLFEHLSAGDPLDVFLDDFEGVSRERAVAVIELAARGLLEKASRS